MSSGTIERPESGTIEEVSFGDAGVDATTYIADGDGAVIVEIETRGVNEPIRVYVNGRVWYCKECGQSSCRC